MSGEPSEIYAFIALMASRTLIPIFIALVLALVVSTVIVSVSHRLGRGLVDRRRGGLVPDEAQPWWLENEAERL
ncbi:hypothetical protein [Streptosporangium sp. KLBMP 9127]|nr:hypothetical protein [Streptosporangium sp. KLBMP 9127]